MIEKLGEKFTQIFLKYLPTWSYSVTPFPLKPLKHNTTDNNTGCSTKSSASLNQNSIK